jgi:hypothetical protein
MSASAANNTNLIKRASGDLNLMNSNAWSAMKKKAIRNHQGSERSIIALLSACTRYAWYSYVKYKQ